VGSINLYVVLQKISSVDDKYKNNSMAVGISSGYQRKELHSEVQNYANKCDIAMDNSDSSSSTTATEYQAMLLQKQYKQFKSESKQNKEHCS
jgi:hypothetical protein